MKRLLQSNTSRDGSLNNGNFLRAILQLRNTPDPDCGHLLKSSSTSPYEMPSPSSTVWKSSPTHTSFPRGVKHGRKRSLPCANDIRTSEALKTHAKQLRPLNGDMVTDVTSRTNAGTTRIVGIGLRKL